VREIRSLTYHARGDCRQRAHASHVVDVLRGILTPRHPSQLYEALLEGAVLFAIMWFVRTLARTPNGFLTGLFMICYAVFRIVVEYFREPTLRCLRGQLPRIVGSSSRLGIGIMVTTMTTN